MPRSTRFRRPLDRIAPIMNRTRDQMEDMIFERIGVVIDDLDEIGWHSVFEGKDTILNTDTLRRRMNRVLRILDEIEHINEESRFAPKALDNWPK